MLAVIISFVVGFFATYGFICWKTRKKSKMNYNLPMADEYKHRSNPYIAKMNTVDGSNAKNDFSMKK